MSVQAYHEMEASRVQKPGPEEELDESDSTLSDAESDEGDSALGWSTGEKQEEEEEEERAESGEKSGESDDSSLSDVESDEGDEALGWSAGGEQEEGEGEDDDEECEEEEEEECDSPEGDAKTASISQMAARKIARPRNRMGASEQTIARVRIPHSTRSLPKSCFRGMITDETPRLKKYVSFALDKKAGDSEEMALSPATVRTLDIFTESERLELMSMATLEKPSTESGEISAAPDKLGETVDEDCQEGKPPGKSEELLVDLEIPMEIADRDWQEVDMEGDIDTPEHRVDHQQTQEICLLGLAEKLEMQEDCAKLAILEWVTVIPSAAEEEEELRKTEKEYSQQLELIWTSADLKQKSWDNFIPALVQQNQTRVRPVTIRGFGTPSHQITTPSPHAIAASPQITATSPQKRTKATRITTLKNYWIPLLLILIYISGLFPGAFRRKSPEFTQLDKYSANHGNTLFSSATPNIVFENFAHPAVRYIGLEGLALLFFQTWISLRWSAERTPKQNFNFLLGEISSIVWKGTSLIFIVATVIYTTGISWLRALALATHIENAATSPGKNISEEGVRRETTQEAKPDVWKMNYGGIGLKTVSSWSAELEGLLIIGEISNVNFGGPDVHIPALPVFPAFSPGGICPRYELGVGSGMKADGGGGAGIGTLALALLSVLIWGGGNRNQLRRSHGRG